MNLVRVGGTVADVDVPRVAPPQQQVRIDFGGSARIEQRMQIDLTDVAGSKISIREREESVGRACVVAGLCT